jgi:hypothetical protein
MVVAPEAIVEFFWVWTQKKLAFFPDASISLITNFAGFLDQNQYAECHARLVAEFSMSTHNCHIVL